MALLECRNVCLGYEGQVILENINFCLNGGEYLFIVGENGTGKSTLIKGLLKLKRPMSGSIIIGDGVKSGEIGYLPQQTLVQKDFPASVYEVVISGRINSLGFRPFYSRKDKDEALDKMNLMGISHLKNKCYNDLSGGQQQRVLLARAMCAAKKMLLLDEPAAGLDPVVTLELYELIARINKEMGMTVIMVSHDMDAMAKYATHVLHLSHKQLFFGDKDVFLKSKESMILTGGEVNGND